MALVIDVRAKIVRAAATARSSARPSRSARSCTCTAATSWSRSRAAPRASARSRTSATPRPTRSSKRGARSSSSASSLGGAGYPASADRRRARARGADRARRRRRHPDRARAQFPRRVRHAFQSTRQLKNYGANIYVADIVGVAMARELAPLITAIIIAGRSGAAYAAEPARCTCRKRSTRCAHEVPAHAVPRLAAVAALRRLRRRCSRWSATSRASPVASSSARRASAFSGTCPQRAADHARASDVWTGLVKACAFGFRAIDVHRLPARPRHPAAPRPASAGARPTTVVSDAVHARRHRHGCSRSCSGGFDVLSGSTREWARATSTIGW